MIYGCGRISYCISFNRYMVECEFYNDTLMEAMKDVLIDTWWNVNTNVQPVCGQSVMVLIDTWWNVNTLRSPDAKTDSTF